MSPKQVRTATFASARKGFDPTEVTTFLDRAAEALEAAQNHATAMEARARAAVAKLQELSSAEPPEPPPPLAQPETEAISRTLLLAQRAADEAIAEARAESERLVDEAIAEARKAGSDERDRIRSEVDALAARREFLQSDVEQLENFLLDQRERLRAAATALVQLAEKVPDGLGYLRPPLLSASDDSDGGDDDATSDATSTRAALESGLAAAHDDDDADTGHEDAGDGADTGDDAGAGDEPRPAHGATGAGAVETPTEALPVIVFADDDDAGSGDRRDPAGRDRTGDDPTPESTQLRFAPGPAAGAVRPDRTDGPWR